MLALRTIITHGSGDEVDCAKAALQARFSADPEEDGDGPVSEDENSVPEDPWNRLNRKQKTNISLVRPRGAVRKQKRDLDTPRSGDPGRADVPAAGPSRRKDLAAPRPGGSSARPQHADVSTASGPLSPGSALEHCDPMDVVTTELQSSVQRRKRKRLDEPTAHTPDVGVVESSFELECFRSEWLRELQQRREVVLNADVPPTSLSMDWQPPELLHQTALTVAHRPKRQRTDDPVI
ncbi:hypothetical protein B0H11DRAFT_2254300 [Mycena galericulata]|nr:hypothetical protein B0H11DRAFT_2254300 [Mycena galericulata]